MPIPGPFPIATKDLATAKSELLLAMELENVDNTADADKPVSTLTQTALNLKADGSALTTLAGRVTTTETDIGTLEGDVATIDAAVGVLEAFQTAKATAIISSITQGGTGSEAITNIVSIPNAAYVALENASELNESTVYLITEDP